MTIKDVRFARTKKTTQRQNAIVEAWNRLKQENPKLGLKPAEVRRGMAKHLRDIAQINPDIADDLLKDARDFETLE